MYGEEVGLDKWKSQDGRITNIVDMDTPHLLNTVALLHSPRGTGNPQRHKLVTLEKEALKRLTVLVKGTSE